MDIFAEIVVALIFGGLVDAWTQIIDLRKRFRLTAIGQEGLRRRIAELEAALDVAAQGSANAQGSDNVTLGPVHCPVHQ